MISNNQKNMKIVMLLNNSLDYEEYAKECLLQENVPMPPSEYSQKVLWLMAGLKAFPDKEPVDAYLAIVAWKDNISEMKDIYKEKRNQGCDNCGKHGDKPLPSLLQQAGNLMTGVAEHVISPGNVDKKTLEFRNNICDSCDNMRSDGRCAECGCYMKIKAKWESAQCPNSKW